MPQEMSEARRCLKQGEFRQAEELLARVVGVEPQNKDAWHELGVVALQLGKSQAAVEHLQRAVALDGGNAAFHNHLGVALAELGELARAVECLRRSVELDPRMSDAHYNLAKALASLHRFEEAARHYRAAIELKPDAPETHFNLANALAELERADEAAAGYREAIRLRPGYLKAYNNLGNLLRDQGKFGEAAAQYEAAIGLKPDYAEGHHNLGLALAAQRRTDEAAEHFRKALEIKPGLRPPRNGLARVLADQGKLDEALSLLDAAAPAREYLGAYLRLGEKLRMAGRTDEALALAGKALEVDPDEAGAYHNLGLALAAKGDFEKATAQYRRALELRPDFADAHNNLGVALHTLGRIAEGMEHFEKALNFRPNLALAHANRAVVWLGRGLLERGWPEFEWRKLCADHRPPRFTQPMWDGSAMPGATILLHAEQGLGDTVQMIRYAPLVKARCGKVVVRSQRALVELLERCRGIDCLVAEEDKLPEHDAQISLMSLPLVLGTRMENIPAETPYLFADARLAESWRERLAGYQGLKVGIAWQGNKKYVADAQRSIPLRYFAGLARVPEVRLFSLQKDAGADPAAELPEPFPLVDFGPDLDSSAGAFMDTAAIMENLDLIITSDTVIAHLAGALGRPTWLAVNYAPDWRWLEHREDCPWYPGMQLFRQEQPGDWDGVFRRIAEELRGLAGGDRGRLQPAVRAISRAPQIPVSAGELLDKIAILRIKSRRIADDEKLANIRRELGELTVVYEKHVSQCAEVSNLLDDLTAVNEELWDIENGIRQCDAQGDFGSRFVEYARAVYATNDRRCKLKRQVDRLLGSPLVEEKEYAIQANAPHAEREEHG